MNQSKYPFGESEITALREQVIGEMSPKRFHHTAAVEDMVTRLATLYCPEEIPALRAAALLHDVTKEYDIPTHVAMLTEAGQPPRAGDEYAHKTFHARTAVLLIPDNYPAFNCEVVVNAVRWHTTGRADMTLTEKLLYLADYIDDSRTFENCVLLRHFFWDSDPKQMDQDVREELLRETLLLSYRMTIQDLLAEGTPIATDTVEARNQLLLEANQKNSSS